MADYIWKIKHIPTGLFYCSRKGRFKSDITNLSEKGNFYILEKQVKKVLEEDCMRTFINEAQTKRYNLPVIDHHYAHNCPEKIEDFQIIKYEIREV